MDIINIGGEGESSNRYHDFVPVKDSSDGFVAIPIQMIEEIINKVHNLFTIEECIY